jgi:hypothetical protein
MEYTQDELITELGRLDRAATKRKLTDWTARGLLPPLEHRGLGKGKGSVYYWRQPDILNQAVAVHDLIEYYRFAESLYVPLWVMGFEVPIEKVREKLMRDIDESMEELRVRGSVEPQALKYTLYDIALEQDKVSPDVAYLWLGALFNPEVEPNDLDIEYAIEGIGTIGASSEVKRTRDQKKREKQWMEAGLAFVREHFSVPRRRRVVSDAADEEFRQVQIDTQMLWRIVRDWFGLFTDSHEWQQQLKHQMRGCNELGLDVALLDLSLRHAGMGNRIDRLLRMADVYSRRVLTNRTVRETLQKRMLIPEAQAIEAGQEV